MVKHVIILTNVWSQTHVMQMPDVIIHNDHIPVRVILDTLTTVKHAIINALVKQATMEMDKNVITLTQPKRFGDFLFKKC